MQTIHAIFENGVFRPVVPLDLPEQAEFVFEPRQVTESVDQNGISTAPQGGSEDALQKVYAILSERYNSGHTDTAARHNEHQP